MSKQHQGRSIRSVVAATVVVGSVLAAAGVVTFTLFNRPFKTVTVDRTPPVVLNKIRDLAQYKAASGSFEVLIDIEKDVKYLPKAIAGERTFFVGIGSVDATVDFGKIADGAVSAAPDRSLATIVLPRAELAQAVVDPAASHVAAHSRGLLNRISGAFNDNPTGERDLYLAAATKINDAAASTGLRDKAEENTRNMLTSLVKALGYENVIVRFEGPANIVSG